MKPEMLDLIIMEGFKCVIGLYAIYTFSKLVKILNKINEKL